MTEVTAWIQQQGIRLLGGIAVLAIGLAIVHGALKLMRRKADKVRLEPTLKGFLGNLLRIVLYMIVALMAAHVMGIPMTSIITLLASAGVAVSLAMQGALSNLVGGVILLAIVYTVLYMLFSILFQAADLLNVSQIPGGKYVCLFAKLLGVIRE